MTSLTTDVCDAHRRTRDIFKLGFDLGREAGTADAQARIDIAEMQADLWYFIANNPEARLFCLDGLADLVTRSVLRSR